MPSRSRLPLCLLLLLPHVRRHRPPCSPVPVRRLLSYYPSSAAAAAEVTLSVEDSVAGMVLPFFGSMAGAPRLEYKGGAAWDGQEEFEREASIVARFEFCHGLLRERRWRETRATLMRLVSKQGERDMSFRVSNYQPFHVLGSDDA
ncbi:hypothetical protein GUJ93_ZPchr0010g7961 [Zizania palustris]|uniref:Uncharacterized protein n=1 Tax=Zizania palustris TaxID=103762 RepID=A0A8J5WEY3_ZIZPA|nr:hypothetical protein GUJ93_ZPchr0010g7961 [Zizania palustris]